MEVASVLPAFGEYHRSYSALNTALHCSHQTVNTIKAWTRALGLEITIPPEVFLKETIAQLQEWELLRDMKPAA